VTTLFTWLVDPVGKLALPNLERLDLYGLGDERPDAAALAPLFGSGRLPKVKRLSICNRPLPVPVLAALLDSPLVKQLEWLELYQNALDDDGVSFVRQHQQKLAHIRILNLDDELAVLKNVFPAQHRTWAKRATDEP
jgi:hypothetical protein